MKKITLIFCFIPFLSFGQIKKDLSTLKMEMNKSSDQSEMEKLVDDFCFDFYIDNFENEDRNFKELLQIVNQSNCKNCLLTIYYWKAEYHYKEYDIKRAIAYLEKAIQNYDAHQLKLINLEENKIIIKIYSFLYKLNIIINDYENAKKYINVLLVSELLNSNPNNNQLLSYYYSLAYVNHKQNNYDLSITNFLVADSLNTSTKSRYSDLNRAEFYVALSEIYSETKNSNKSIYYQKETIHNLNNAKEGFIKTDNQRGLNIAYLNEGKLFFEQKNNHKAIEILNQARKYFKKNEEKEILTEIYLLLGKSNIEINQFSIAENYLVQASNNYKKMGDSLHLGLSYYFLGKKNLEINDKNNAKKFLNRALSIFNRQKSFKNQINTLNELSVLMEKNKDYKKGLYYIKQRDSVDDFFQEKLYGNSKNDLEVQYKSKKKAQEIDLLKTKNELINEQKLNQRIVLLSGIGISTLLGLFFFLQYRNRMEINKKLKELDRAKSTFFSNISHEFRTPLTLIQGPIEDQLNSSEISLKQRRNLQIVKNNTKRLESLIDQLLALSKLESGKLKLNLSSSNLPQFIINHAENFTYLTQEKQLNFKIDIIKDNRKDWFDTDAIEKILTNFISNAIKYTPENESIEIKGERINEDYLFSINNTGTYLNDKQKEQIFNRFYQTDTHNTGTGIGLALTKELVQLHKGKIEVQSDIDTGTIFKVIIPISKDNYLSSEILSEELQEDEIIQQYVISDEIENTTLLPEETPTLLIVEDNIEIRNYIFSIFENSYKVTIAKDGKQGFEKALDIIPDIIISDIMMPNQNGIEFSNTIKNHKLTNHIPIILLTAKTDVQDKLEGLKTGADAYITKPFSSIILKGTVVNLLENRRLLQQRFSKNILLVANDMNIRTADDKFVKKLKIVLDEFITEQSFSIQKFSAEMGVSRMQLHRKLKAITGQTTSEFVKIYRLNLAAKQLKEKNIPVAEIAYTVGFNEPSYFTRCFKKEFGCSPKDYAAK